MPPARDGGSMVIRLVMVDGHPLIRLGLMGAVAGCDDIAAVGEAGTGAEAHRVVAESKPTVVIISARLPDGDGVAAAGRLRQAAPDLGIVLLADMVDDVRLLKAIDMGLSAYVTKSSTAARILAAIRHAGAEPHSFVSPGLSAVLRDQPLPNGLLSRRELQVLMLMQEGMSIGSIATRLLLSESTVKTYSARIYGKLQVNSRSQALMTALSRGFLTVHAEAA